MLIAGNLGDDGDRSVLLREDFSDPSGRWLVDSDENGSMGYRDGSYRIEVSRRGELQSLVRLGGEHSSLRVQVDAALISGDGGISVLCISELSGTPGRISELDDRGTYYDFFVSFAEDAYAVLRSDDLGTPLAAADDRERLLGDGEHRVVVRCAGASEGRAARLALTLDGREVLTTKDDDGAESFMAIGLSVYSGSGAAAAEFDDVVVSIP